MHKKYNTIYKYIIYGQYFERIEKWIRMTFKSWKDDNMQIEPSFELCEV